MITDKIIKKIFKKENKRIITPSSYLKTYISAIFIMILFTSAIFIYTNDLSETSNTYPTGAVIENKQSMPIEEKQSTNINITRNSNITVKDK